MWIIFITGTQEDNRETFYEGAFLEMLFKKLQRILDQVGLFPLIQLWCRDAEEPGLFLCWIEMYYSAIFVLSPAVWREPHGDESDVTAHPVPASPAARIPVEPETSFSSRMQIAT